MWFLRKSISSLLVSMTLLLFLGPHPVWSQSNHGSKFEQLGTLLRDANTARGIDGAPGPDYWQQRCDYEINCRLDVDNLTLHGEEVIVYYNQSPNSLRYLWLQLDENQHSVENDNQYFDPSTIKPVMSESELKMLETWREREDYGFRIEEVSLPNGASLPFTINQTMMRVDLPEVLQPGGQFSFHVKWHYKIIDRIAASKLISGSQARNLARGGYEYFPDDGNYLFTMTQWYPRLCVYSDFEGWQNKQFTGRGEFALTFGNFVVKITVPNDQIVGATGECLNYETVLTYDQQNRWRQAQHSDAPIEIVTYDEAVKNERAKASSSYQTWIYKAENVRDFAWTASKKFIWDAMPHTTSEGEKVLCMSYYGKEAYPIYRKYSTKAVAHTLRTYSKYSIPYPYPVAISVEAASGMEYPMICFNPGRAEKDGTYTEAAKKSAISVIIHEVGHNYFPMIINSDERQWAWFDEGLNSFVQFLSESEWDNNYQSWFGPANQITDYMSLPKDQLEPIMTNSENIVDYFNNAYSKPATALNILRETIMGRELFDFAFQEYCRRWAFKHPTPADFFRTMEDASSMDLDWFWKGWFYTTDAVDISLDSIIWYKVDAERDPQPQQYVTKSKSEAPFQDISRQRNREENMAFEIEIDTALKDFYDLNPSYLSEDSIQKTVVNLYGEKFSKKEKSAWAKHNFYELTFSNRGGLVMPIVIEWTFADGTKEIQRIPVEVWRLNEHQFSKVFLKEKVVTSVIIDPYQETADIDRSNNMWPEFKQVPSKFQIYKQHKTEKALNPMQKAMKKKKGRS